MRKICFIVLVAWVGLVSCLHRNKIPSNIIPPDKMERILFDLALSEEYVISFLVKDSVKNRDSLLGLEADKVLKIYKVDQSQFHESFEFYESRPDILKVTMDSLYERVQRNREKLYRGKAID